MAILVIAVVALGGCASTPDPGPEGPPAQATPAVRILDLPMNAGEPQIVVRSESTWFVGAINGGFPFLYRTTDAGTTWTNVTPPFITGSQDVSIALGPEGSIWVISLWRHDPYPQTDLGAFCSALAASPDDGLTWTIDDEVCVAPVSAERPWLAFGDAGLGLLQVAGPAGSSLLTFGVPTGDSWVFEPVPTSFFMFGPMVADGPGWSFPLVEGTAGSPNGPGSFGLTPQALQVAHRDAGGEWSFEQVTDDAASARWPQLAVATAGRMVGWLSDLDPATASTYAPAPALHVKVAASTGSGWDERQLSVDGTNHFLWLAANTSSVVPVWLHANASAHPETLASGEPWRIQFDRDGRLVTLPVVVHRGPLCVFGFQGDCQADGRRAMGDFLSAELLEDGTLLVAYADGTRAEGKPFNGPIQVAVVPAGFVA